MTEKLVLDTSVIINGKVPEYIRSGEWRDCEVVVPRAVLDELQAQASRAREPGFIGLQALKEIRRACEERQLVLRFVGDRPSLEDIRLARSGRIDAIIRDVAKQENGTLVTADYVQALVGEAEGVRVRHIRPAIKVRGLRFEDYFTPDTLSVHLKVGVPPMAKRGGPGEFELVRIDERALTEDELQGIIKEITEATRISAEGSVEISRSGATVLQFGAYRIAITRPPFSDDIEVTVVRPTVRLTLDDYRISDKLRERLRGQAEGVVIAGPPGSGKSTLASSLANFYKGLGRVVKTFESPRDLQVDPEVTQYGPLEGDFEKTAEILLLVRPDYTVFDEVRKTRDFEVFTDMRLAGVGMVGVVHSSNPIDAVQRFMGRVELGVIPHILDTVIFVRAGEIRKVLTLHLAVKVPTGMTEADLARPVVEVREFETGRLEYEIYTFGEENVIVPVDQVARVPSPVQKLAEERIRQVMRKFDPEAYVELLPNNRAVVRVDKSVIPRLIGRGGVMIQEIEDNLGIRIDVEPRVPALGRELTFDHRETGNALDLVFEPHLAGKRIGVYVADEFLVSAVIGRKGKVRVSKDSEAGRRLVAALATGKPVRVAEQS